jgi:hypothetical protein
VNQGLLARKACRANKDLPDQSDLLECQVLPERSDQKATRVNKVLKVCKEIRDPWVWQGQLVRRVNLVLKELPASQEPMDWLVGI